MSCGVEMCPAGTVGGVTMRGGGFSRKRAWRGGGCGCSANRMLVGQRGGGCGCMNKTLGLIGGYRATARNRKYLRRFRQGKSIGFTMRSSLKAKGLIPRANGTYKVSAKYKTRRSRK